ncbi:flagellar motor switch protein FliM [Paraconexibacter sp.]|uniref:flagellar motor switch protein FliM n=1 Tax=Paraconexibacter sp. TaxID=2949640 RepID=UPI00356461ED
MNDFLSPDEIEKLFERASDGNLPMETDRHQTGGRRARWLRTVDFTRPTKFSTDQERRLRRLLDAFCQSATTRLVAEHRLPVEFEVIDVQQLTWANAFALLPDNSVHATIATQPHESKMLLSAERALLCTALEGLLGGRAEDPIAERELSDLDLILVRRFIGTLVELMSGSWFDLAEVTLETDRIDTQSEAVQVAPGSEPTLVLTMEARLHRVTSTVALLVPFSAIDPVGAAFSRREEDEGRHDPSSKRALRAGLERVDVTVRAEVAQTTLTLEEILTLKPGDLVALDGRAGDDVTLWADRTPVHHARAGRHAGRRAVQLTTPVVPEP